MSILVNQNSKVIAQGIAFLCTLLLAAPAAAEQPVSPLVDIYESYNDCLKVAAKGGLKLDVLAAL
ncbi:MAG: hypothetical protein ABIP07_06170, partial [Sphingomicrobium sp.]